MIWGEGELAGREVAHASSHFPSSVKVPLFPALGLLVQVFDVLCTQAWSGLAQINAHFWVWKLEEQEGEDEKWRVGRQRRVRPTAPAFPDPHQQLPPVSPPPPTLVAVPRDPRPTPTSLSQPYWTWRLHPFHCCAGCTYMIAGWVHWSLVLDNFSRKRVGLPLLPRRNSRHAGHQLVLQDRGAEDAGSFP